MIPIIHEHAEEWSPELLKCPLSKRPFVDPVVAGDGCTYERESLWHYTCENRMPNTDLIHSPVTSELMKVDAYPCPTLKRLSVALQIDTWPLKRMINQIWCQMAEFVYRCKQLSFRQCVAAEDAQTPNFSTEHMKKETVHRNPEGTRVAKRLRIEI